MTSNSRAHLQTLIEEMRAWAGPESEWDQKDATPQQVLAWADRLSALIAEGPSQQDDGVEQRADEAFRELATYKEDAEDTEAAPRSAQATAESEKAK